jgi:DNA-binding GntR family transcriptional regulator
VTHDIYACDVARRPGRTGPKYRQIADDLRSRIERGEYRPGSRLPTKAELMTQHHVAVNTVERAIEELRKARLVETAQGAGMFVTEAAQNLGTSASIGDRMAALEKRVDLLETLIMDLRANAGLEQSDHEDESRAEAR